MNLELSIVIPAYNESMRLGPTLAAILSYLENEDIEAEVIVVDDGSTDNTAELGETMLAHNKGCIISYSKRRGKGYAVRMGVAQAVGRWVLISDADLSTPIEEYQKLKQIGENGGHDLVFGSRSLPESQIEIPQSRLRQGMGKCFNSLVRLISGLRFKDTQCGFKLFRRDSAGPIFDQLVVDGFAFDVELLMLCKEAGIDAVEAPVVWRNDAHSSVHLLASPPRMLWDVIKTVIRMKRGHYCRMERNQR